MDDVQTGFSRGLSESRRRTLLVANDHVRTVIPLTEILPYSIEFEEDIWKIPFALLNIKRKIGEVSYES